MQTRVLPSKIQARTFELLGAVPLRIDLTEALEGIAAGTIDAQENPLANTVTYGAHKFHKFHTLSGHFYVSRGVFANRAAFEAMPDDIQAALQKAVAGATTFQRDLAVAEEDIARQAILDEGCEITELTPAEPEEFVAAVQPIYAEARALFSDEMFEMLPKS